MPAWVIHSLPDRSLLSWKIFISQFWLWSSFLVCALVNKPAFCPWPSELPVCFLVIVGLWLRVVHLLWFARQRSPWLWFSSHEHLLLNETICLWTCHWCTHTRWLPHPLCLPVPLWSLRSVASWTFCLDNYEFCLTLHGTVILYWVYWGYRWRSLQMSRATGSNPHPSQMAIRRFLFSLVNLYDNCILI